MSFTIFPVSLVVGSLQTLQLPVAVEVTGPVASGIHAIAISMVFVTQGTAAGQPDQIPKFLSSIPTPSLSHIRTS